MEDKRFMLTYSDDGSEVYQWFDTENELIDFVKQAKKKWKKFKVVDAIEIIQSRNIEL